MNLLKAGFIFMVSIPIIRSTTTYYSVYPATDVPVMQKPLIASTTITRVELPDLALKTRLMAISEATGVSYFLMESVIECESGFNPNAIGDNEHSYGLVQIFLDYHPTVTKEQALDPEFAMNFLAQKIKEGKGELWTCYRNLKLNT